MAVTEEDVRRAYYANAGAPQSWWITELQLDPSQLVVSDGDGRIYLVPFTVDADDVAFGEPAELVSYDAVAATRGSGTVWLYASAAESRAVTVEAAWDGGAAVRNLGDDPSASQIRAAFALPGATKSDSSLPHHNVSASGEVGGPNADGCSAAIGALNGARGGLKGVSPDAARAAYNHLAAHLRDLGQTPPPFTAAAGDPGDVNETFTADQDEGGEEDEDWEPDVITVDAAGNHAPASVTHTHPHPAYGAQSGDQSHEHEHTHEGDNEHAHEHQPAAAGTNQEGGSDVQFTDEHIASLRESLGLGETDQMDDPGALVEAVAKVARRAAQFAAATGRKLPEGVIAVEREAWDALQVKVRRGEEFRERQLIKERDGVIEAAVAAGKFTAARRDHWKRLWDADPEGTRVVLAGLQRNVVPINDVGIVGDSEDELLEEEYKRLFPPGAAR